MDYSPFFDKGRGIPRANLLNKVFGKLTVKEFNGPSATGEGATWRCVCECGSERIVTTKKLNGNQVRSCGCANKKSDGGRGKKRGRPVGSVKVKNTPDFSALQRVW